MSNISVYFIWWHWGNASMSHCVCVCVCLQWTRLTSPVSLSRLLSLSLCTFPGRAVQWISPWMYVTMMMTDQIPLDLAPPPLLNGEVPLMPHMVNGDAAQQVNTCTHARTHTDVHTHTLTHTPVVCIQTCRCFFQHSSVAAHTHTLTRLHARTHIKQSCWRFSLLSFRHMAHELLPQVMSSCYSKAFVKNNRNRHRHLHHLVPETSRQNVTGWLAPLTDPRP